MAPDITISRTITMVAASVPSYLIEPAPDRVVPVAVPEFDVVVGLEFPDVVGPASPKYDAQFFVE